MVPLAVVVIMGLLFLDQLTAITRKYVGTSRWSSRALISFRAMSAFFCSVSRIGGLNCSIRCCGFALGLVSVSDSCGCDFDVMLQVGLITIGFADLTQCGSGTGSMCVLICLGVGNGVDSLASIRCDGLKLAQEKLTTISNKFLMVEWAMVSSAWAATSSALVSHASEIGRAHV